MSGTAAFAIIGGVIIGVILYIWARWPRKK